VAASHASHSLFTRDGEDPAELRRIGREQLGSYTTVRVEDREVIGAEGQDGDFRLRFVDGGEVAARKVILATGVRDILPEIDGFRRLWGKSVIHCPFCDGWEVRDQPWAVLTAPSEALRYAAMLSTWTRDLVVLTNGDNEIGAETRRGLADLGVSPRTESISRLEAEGTRLRRVIFESGEAIERAVLLHRPRQQPRTDLANQLGCDLVPDGMIPGLIRVDQIQQTTVPGVFAVGDVTTPMQQVALAVSSGLTAGSMANHQFVNETLATYAPRE